jgi:hypothetical protein
VAVTRERRGKEKEEEERALQWFKRLSRTNRYGVTQSRHLLWHN